MEYPENKVTKKFIMCPKLGQISRKFDENEALIIKNLSLIIVLYKWMPRYMSLDDEKKLSLEGFYIKNKSKNVGPLVWISIGVHI